MGGGFIVPFLSFYWSIHWRNRYKNLCFLNRACFIQRVMTFIATIFPGNRRRTNSMTTNTSCPSTRGHTLPSIRCAKLKTKTNTHFKLLFYAEKGNLCLYIFSIKRRWRRSQTRTNADIDLECFPDFLLFYLDLFYWASKSPLRKRHLIHFDCWLTMYIRSLRK